MVAEQLQGDRCHVEAADAPSMAFYGVGNDSQRASKASFPYQVKSVGVSTRVPISSLFAVGGAIDSVAIDSTAALSPTYRRSGVFAEIDSRTSPDYTRRG